MTTRSMQSIRQAVLRINPELPFSRKYPRQLAGGLVLLGLAVALTTAIVSGLDRLPLAAIAGLSLLLGVVHGLCGFFAHELLHGSILFPRGRGARACVRALAWCGFLIFGTSPELWLTWHNRIHHFHTNEPGIDPDSFGLWSEFRELPMSGFVLDRAPGSRHWLSWVYLPFNFNNQALTVMWFFLWKGEERLFAPVRKGVAVAETLAMYAFWTAFVMLAGAKAALWAFFVPLLAGNLVASGFILVQHLFCPLTEVNDPLENTMGVTLPRWLDRLTFNFGHHVEHHCFPELNHRHYPELREQLRRMYPESYRLMPFGQAIVALLRTPRVYRDDNTLLDPRTGLTVDVSQVGRRPSTPVPPEARRVPRPPRPSGGPEPRL